MRSRLQGTNMRQIGRYRIYRCHCATQKPNQKNPTNPRLPGCHLGLSLIWNIFTASSWHVASAVETAPRVQPAQPRSCRDWHLQSPKSTNRLAAPNKWPKMAHSSGNPYYVQPAPLHLAGGATNPTSAPLPSSCKPMSAITRVSLSTQFLTDGKVFHEYVRGMSTWDLHLINVWSWTGDKKPAPRALTLAISLFCCFTLVGTQ